MEHLLDQLGRALAHLPGQPHAQLLFQGVLFFVVFTAVYALYTLLGKTKARVYILLGFSLYFYYKFSGWFVFLLIGTGGLGWLLGQAIARTRHQGRRDLYKYTAIALSLGLLAYFKYTNFFVQSYWSLANPGEAAPLYDILLPIGISYYTFRGISYILEVHGGEPAEPNPAHYLCYLSFFPSMLAGPISRQDELLPALRQPYTLSRVQMGTAFFLFIKGLFKKVVIADYLAENFVNRIFGNPGQYSGLENLMATYAFGFQLYADFSGYIDMALGIALLLGFELRPNFNEPFKAGNISEFWRRWHMTLSSWFNDYVFVPLSFAWRRWRRLGTVLAVLLTFFLSGLWHGPHWGYVLWGSSHGLIIALEVAGAGLRRRIRTAMPHGLYRLLSILLTYQVLAFTYILFQAAVLGKDLAYIGLMYDKILTQVDYSLLGDFVSAYRWVVVVLLLAVVLHFLPCRYKEAVRTAFVRCHWLLQGVIIALAVVLIYQVKSAALLPFVYLQF
ncbi:MAG: hypothetical protein LW884_03005 [Bacteroidetes bacterium]|jgi:D-alanyl-lipoteichoic acid acyltransferase DltB (MBOAT superfamily)|nr:hypothetical protein [Bacteroidota bacterium]